MRIAIDFDGTIVEHDYPKIGKPIPFALEVLSKLIMDGHLLILWTVREGNLLDEAVEYCKKNGVQFYAVNSSYPLEINSKSQPRKITADLYIDDRNLGGLPDWGLIYQIICSGGQTNFDSIMMNKTRKKKNFFIKLGELIEKIRTEGLPKK